MRDLRPRRVVTKTKSRSRLRKRRRMKTPIPSVSTFSKIRVTFRLLAQNQPLIQKVLISSTRRLKSWRSTMERLLKPQRRTVARETSPPTPQRSLMSWKGFFRSSDHRDRFQDSTSSNLQTKRRQPKSFWMRSKLRNLNLWKTMLTGLQKKTRP